jgi:hypothetical protein
MAIAFDRMRAELAPLAQQAVEALRRLFEGDSSS